MTISINPIGYNAQTNLGVDYKKSNLAKTAAITAIGAGAAAIATNQAYKAGKFDKQIAEFVEKMIKNINTAITRECEDEDKRKELIAQNKTIFDAILMDISNITDKPYLELEKDIKIPTFHNLQKPKGVTVAKWGKGL